MENAAGSADAEMSIIEQSLDFKLNALKETWVGTAQEILNRGDLGIAIEGLTDLSKLLGFILTKFGSLKTLIAGFGIGAFVKNFA